MHIPTVTTILPIFLLGCEELGMKTIPYEDTTDTASSTHTDGFFVEEIDPNYGNPAGNTPITIKGNGFEGDVVVSFGNYALDVTIIDDQTIIFRSPPSPTEGQVDVTVESDVGRETIENGFTYTNNAPVDSGQDTGNNTDTGDSETPTQTGLTGGFVELWRKAYACPDCFDPPMPQQTIESSFSVHSPTNGSWLSWLPPLNSCVLQFNYPHLSNSDFAGNSVTIQNSTTSFALTYDNTASQYSNNYVPLSAYSHNTIYGITTNSFTIPQILQTPNTFTDLQPLTAFSADGFAQPFSKSNFAVLWGPSGTSDYILFLLEVYGNTYSSVLCLTTDSGGLGLDPSLLSNTVANSPLVISLYRLQLTGAIHPSNGSTIEALGGIGVIGTGYLTE